MNSRHVLFIAAVAVMALAFAHVANARAMEAAMGSSNTTNSVADISAHELIVQMTIDNLRDMHSNGPPGLVEIAMDGGH